MLQRNAFFDLTIVFVGGEFTLHEDKRAFDKTADHLVIICSKAHDVVPLCSLLPLVVLVLPDFLVATLNLMTGVPFGSCLLVASLPR
jgi:hypothetical protein